jgi:hypothetical protein
MKKLVLGAARLQEAAQQTAELWQVLAMRDSGPVPLVSGDQPITARKSGRRPQGCPTPVDQNDSHADKGGRPENPRPEIGRAHV